MRFNPLDYPICLSYPRRFAESAWLGHIPFGMMLVEILRPRTIAELGVHTGVSYSAFCQAVDDLGLQTHCYGIDTWRGDQHSGFYEPSIRNDLKAYHDSLYSNFSTLVESTFDDARSRFEDGALDLLHIDGYHTYEAVKNDFETWLPKMSDRGVVLLHDTAVRERDFGVWRLWEELEQRFPTFQFHHHYGLGVVLTGDEAPAELHSLCSSSPAESEAIERYFFELGSRLVEAGLERQQHLNRLIESEAEIQALRHELAGHYREAGRDDTPANSSVHSWEREAYLLEILNSRAWRWIQPFWRVKGMLRISSDLLHPRRVTSPTSKEMLTGPFPDELMVGLDSDIPRSLPIGKGNALFISGWCYHRQQPISNISIVIRGERYPVKVFVSSPTSAHSDESPEIGSHDHGSDFWAVIPLTYAAPVVVDVELQAALGNGRVVGEKLGTIQLTRLGEHEAPPDVCADLEGVKARIAICMAAYDPPLHLFRRQIESIKAQTNGDWVCIISDDASPARTVAVMREIVGEDARFCFVSGSERRGFYKNFEYCLSLVPPEAEFVALSDHDDYWHADKLDTLVNEFEKGTTLVYSDMNIVAEDGSVLSTTYWTTRANNYRNFASLLLANTVSGAVSMFRAAILPYVLPFPIKVGDSYHDHWIAAVALSIGDIKYVDRPLFDYMQHSRNVIGHAAHQPVTAWRHSLFFLSELTTGGARSWGRRYLAHTARLSLLSTIIQLRVGDALSSSKRRVLRRLENGTSLLTAFWLVVRSFKRLGRPTETNGVEWHLVRSILWARGYRVINRTLHTPHTAEITSGS